MTHPNLFGTYIEKDKAMRNTVKSKYKLYRINLNFQNICISTDISVHREKRKLYILFQILYVQHLYIYVFWNNYHIFPAYMNFCILDNLFLNVKNSALCNGYIIYVIYVYVLSVLPAVLAYSEIHLYICVHHNRLNEIFWIGNWNFYASEIIFVFLSFYIIFVRIYFYITNEWV